MINIPFFTNYFDGIRNDLYKTGTTSEKELKVKTKVIGITSLLLSSFTFILLNILYSFNIFYFTALFLSCVCLNKLLVKLFCGNKDIKILNDLLIYIDDIKHFYHSTKMVDESFNLANKKTDGVMRIHGENIYKILTSPNSKSLLQEYYNICPNRFLKILAGFSQLVNEYGDKKENNVSVYIKNLNYITDEIQLEILKRKELVYWLKGINIIALFPLLLAPFIKKWLINSFSMSKSFFVSAQGFYITFFLIIITVCSFFLLLQIQTLNTAKSIKKGNIDKLILKNKYFRSFSKIVSPSESNSMYTGTKKTIDFLGTNESVESFYIKKFLYCVLGFVISIALFTAGININKSIIINDPYYKIKNPNYTFFSNTTEEYSEYEKAQVEMDKQILKELSENGDTNVESIIDTYLTREGLDETAKDTAKERILNKIEYISREKFSLTFFLISILIAIISYFIPNFITYFKKELRKLDMEDEIFQFHTIIILLINHKNTDVKVIIEWLKEFSNIFKSDLEICLKNFNMQNAALQKLKDSVPFPPFVKIVETLENANNDISLSDAFNNLEMERTFYRENRKEANKKQVNRKIEFGQLIGFIPLYSTILLYLTYPLIQSSFNAFEQIKQQLL